MTKDQGEKMSANRLDDQNKEVRRIVHYIYHEGIEFTLLYFKMAVIPLIPETKMAEVGKLISLGNLLVRKIS